VSRINRRGFSLAEVLVGLVILGIVSVLFTRLIVGQARFFDRQAQSNAARNVSRGTLNRVVSDLRMVEAEGGVISATSTAVTVRVPYAMGVVCQTTGSPAKTEVSLLPVDSVMYNAPGFYGYGWRDNTTGAFTYVEAGSAVTPSQVNGACTSLQITTVTNGIRVSLTPLFRRPPLSVLRFCCSAGSSTSSNPLSWFLELRVYFARSSCRMEARRPRSWRRRSRALRPSPSSPSIAQPRAQPRPLISAPSVDSSCTLTE
jgi:prepilin-type N-terminal cleavage/methylation domain